MTAFDDFLTTPALRGVFADAALVQAMLDFEAALAAACADAGIVPPAAAAAIAAACRAALHDVPALLAAAPRAGSLAIPLLQSLRERVAHTDADAAALVHLGGTTQDVVDTALVLLTRRALAHVDHDLGRVVDALLDIAERHAATPALGRTLLQPAAPVSLGHKACTWVAPLVRGRERLHDAGRRALQLQFGGAVGTLATLGDHGPDVARRLGAGLDLPWPGAAWHTQRDDWITLACTLGVLVGSLGKFARDLSLLSQAEVGELTEPAAPGRGASSAMPHKRNPVACLQALAAAARVPAHVAALLGTMAQEHERGLGNWHAELAEWAQLLTASHGAVAALADAAPSLQVHPERLRQHLQALQATGTARAPSRTDAAPPDASPPHADVAMAARRVHEVLPGLRERARALQATAPWREHLAGEPPHG